MKRKRDARRSRSLKQQSGEELQFAAENANDLHQPVLLAECLQYLEPENGGTFIDCTLGMGGHSAAILAASSDTKVIGIDRDTEAIERASERLQIFENRFRVVHSDYREIKTIVAQAGIEKVAGVLADLGVSSWQLNQPERGFSFRFDAPLDMRMNQSGDDVTAAELLKELSEEEIANVIYEYGEERASRRIARRIVERRERNEPIETTDQLAELVAKVTKSGKHERIHPATKTFQALRIAVNRELEKLDVFLSDAIDILEPDGKLAVISFHSLEDRIVKNAFRKLAGVCECPTRLPVCQCGAVKKVEILTRRPIAASAAETLENPRARSAKLRVCKRLAD